METRKIEITVPAELVPFLLLSDDNAQMKRNAMLLYPYIQDCTISHGKAAEILGINKLDLIALYGKMGIDYFQETKDDLAEDLQNLKKM